MATKIRRNVENLTIAIIIGCTSGHGITGLPSFHVGSWFTVPSMFAGAILTGTVLSKSLGQSAYLLK